MDNKEEVLSLVEKTFEEAKAEMEKASSKNLDVEIDNNSTSQSVTLKVTQAESHLFSCVLTPTECDREDSFFHNLAFILGENHEEKTGRIRNHGEFIPKPGPALNDFLEGLRSLVLKTFDDTKN